MPAPWARGSAWGEGCTQRRYAGDERYPEMAEMVISCYVYFTTTKKGKSVRKPGGRVSLHFSALGLGISCFLIGDIVHGALGESSRPLPSRPVLLGLWTRTGNPRASPRGCGCRNPRPGTDASLLSAHPRGPFHATWQPVVTGRPRGSIWRPMPPHGRRCSRKCTQLLGLQGQRLGG